MGGRIGSGIWKSAGWIWILGLLGSYGFGRVLGFWIEIYIVLRVFCGFFRRGDWRIV